MMSNIAVFAIKLWIGMIFILNYILIHSSGNWFTNQDMHILENQLLGQENREEYLIASNSFI